MNVEFVDRYTGGPKPPTMFRCCRPCQGTGVDLARSTEQHDEPCPDCGGMRTCSWPASIRKIPRLIINTVRFLRFGLSRERMRLETEHGWTYWRNVRLVLRIAATTW